MAKPAVTAAALPAAPMVLVTVATGYIGGRLVPGMLAAGFRVRVVTRKPEPDLFLRRDLRRSQ